MTVERTAHSVGRSGTVALQFPPAVQVGHGLALVETEDVHLVHGGAGFRFG